MLVAESHATHFTKFSFGFHGNTVETQLSRSAGIEPNLWHFKATFLFVRLVQPCKVIFLMTTFFFWLSLGFLDPSDVANILNKCVKMRAFVHPHVMGILGISLDEQAPYIVMLFMANGSLHSYLRKHRAELPISEDEDIDLVCHYRSTMNCLHAVSSWCLSDSSKALDVTNAYMQVCTTQKRMTDMCLQIAKGT